MLNIAMVAYTTLSTDSRVIREALAAKESGFNVDLYTLNEKNKINLSGINIVYTNNMQYKGNNKFKFIFGYINFLFFCFFQISKNYFQKRYQILHVNNMPNFLVFCCILPKLLGSKVILDIHDLMPEVYAQKFNIPLHHPFIKLLYFEERLSGNFANVVIATNRLHSKRFKENKIKKDKFPEILNAADENVFKPTKNHNFNSEKIIIIYPTTIAKHLGIDILINALEIIKNKNHKFVLKIFGDGEYRSEAIKSVKEKGLEHFINFSDGFISLSRLSNEMNKSHIGIFPASKSYSNNIAMPNKIHEYFIKGLCVIASDTKIIREYFSNCILLFKSDDPKNLADKIETLIKDRDLLKEYANKGYKYYLKHPWSKYKKRYINLLNELANEKIK